MTTTPSTVLAIHNVHSGRVELHHAPPGALRADSAPFAVTQYPLNGSGWMETTAWRVYSPDIEVTHYRTYFLDERAARVIREPGTLDAAVYCAADAREQGHTVSAAS
jgi:hypothetical protein